MGALGDFKSSVKDCFSRAFKSLRKQISGELPVVIQRIEDWSDPRIDEVISVLVVAFKDNIATRAMIGGKEELRDKLHRAVVRGTVVGGQLWVALGETDRVVGVALWYPPGTGFLLDETQYNTAFSQFFTELQRVYPTLHNWWATVLLTRYSEISKKYFGTSDDPEGRNFQKDNWNLISLSVVPELQRHGIGRTLLKIGEDKAASENKSVCIESEAPDHIDMYNRLGYRTVGSEHIEGPPGQAGYDRVILVKSR